MSKSGGAGAGGVRPNPDSDVFVKKKYTTPWAQKSRDKDDKEGARGPVGLHLLHSSPEPLLDLIFVHGLRGGSIKTWRKGSDPLFFWPQSWLPMEPGLHNVNIHSFGYDSDWANTKSSILSVHDFGQSLLEEMRNSPYLRNNGNRPIILLGHSMGGLVIKKAYILAQDLSDFTGRIRCIFFLATPHRGSDYAAVLNNILTVSGIMSSRDYITDITTGSISSQLINDDFARCANKLPIFSFFETLRMSLGLSSGLIVEKNSAVLGPGFRNERVQYLNANHRDICKFESRDDPNYITLKNALTSAVQDLLKNDVFIMNEESTEQMLVIKSYLGISDEPGEHYQKVEGSCQWIDTREDFQGWKNWNDDVLARKQNELRSKIPSAFWVYANPGTGKTILATHVISELQKSHLECAYFYFHIGERTSRSLGVFLRSIAYQMAMSNTAIRKKLAAIQHEGSTFDMDDSWTIWTKLFKRGILRASVYTPQYWVIDAIDECNKFQEFFTMLRNEKPSFPLRIFITSRKIPNMQQLYRTIEASTSMTSIEIPVRDSLNDVERYIQSRINNLPIENTTDKQDVAHNLLHRSNACFLWVRLVLDELEKVFSNETILQVLQRIPEGMTPYYERTMREMAENKREKHIAKAILVWVVTSFRKLTTSELSQALNLDINTVLSSAKGAVEGLCGQLVSVDKQSDLVDVIHPTVREFLLSTATSEFSISEPLAHARIALTCLRLLCSKEMQPPRNRRFLTRNRPDPSPFLDYALTQFSEHIHSASSEDNELLITMNCFFTTNVLSWIEKIALKGDLYCLIRTSKNMKAYLDRRTEHRPSLSGPVENLEGWQIDLSMLVTRFGKVLLEEPSSIYFLIPPLCPPSSAIYQQYGERPDGLGVVGFKNNAWDDTIASIGFGEDIPAAVCCGEHIVAVGMESGDVNLYNNRSCQREGVLHHKYPVDLVHLTETYIAACTTRSIVFQDLEGNMFWETRLRFRCTLLASYEKFIVAVSEHGHVLKWDIATGSLIEDQSFVYKGYDVETEYKALAARAPFIASISPDFEILALGYRGGAVCLWELQSGEFIDWARDEQNKLASKILFNPNPNINLLLIIYTNHDLSLYEPWSGSLVFTRKTPNDIGLLSASCSPDGRTLVTSEMHGNMQIWDFESLTLLYQVLSPFPSFRILNFTSDGSRVVDVMDSGIRIWSPAALVRKDIEDNGSPSDDVIHAAVTNGQRESVRKSRITALCTHPSLPVAFVGKYNGQVLAFNTKTGQQTSVLYSHSQTAFITELAVTKNNLIASSDVTSVVQVWKLLSNQSSTMKSDSLLLQINATAQVKQLCFSIHGEYLLVATSRFDRVYSMEDGSCIGSLYFESYERKVWQWLPAFDQGELEGFTLFSDHVLKKYSAQDFPSMIDGYEIFLHYELGPDKVEANIDSAVVHTETQTLVLDVRHDSSYVLSSTMFMFDLSKIPSGSSIATLTPLSDVLPDFCEHFVGIREHTKSFVFLHKNLWLSSIDLDNLALNHYTQHFFVPNEYISTSHGALPVKTADDDIVFCLHGELVIVKNGLKFQTTKPLR